MPANRPKRAGRTARTQAVLRDIHSSLDGLPSGSHSGHSHNLKGSSAAKLTIDAAKYFECAAVEETREDHIVPRQSITRQQYLGAFPVRVETETIPTRQLDKQSGELVETTDERITWRSDRSLLRRNKPFKDIGIFKREGMVAEGLNTRKYRAIEHETPTSEDEIDLGPEIEHVDFPE